MEAEAPLELTWQCKEGTEAIPLGVMPFALPGPQGTSEMSLWLYIDKHIGPSVAATSTDRGGRLEVLTWPLQYEHENIDPHLTEAFRHAREKGLIH